MPVNTERQDYRDMNVKWERLRDCFEGRDAILKAGSKYVPDLPGADALGNQSYRKRGCFYNAVARTVTGMNGVVFQKPPEVEFPETFEEYLDDVTLTNIPFEMFAVEAGREVVLLGRYGILVDMPAVESADNRPYLVGYKAEDICNWKTTRVGGDEVLTMVVLREHVEAPYNPEDMFHCELIVQYRVVWLKDGICTVQLYREETKQAGNWVLYGNEQTLMRRGEALRFIPFVFLGALAPTPGLELPPLLDLADVNLGHWRNSVDHEYGLHLVALPTPWVSGSKGGQEGKMKIGPSVVWELELQGSAGMLEFQGQGLGAIVTAMEAKKKEMAALGARLLEDTTQSNETATAVRIKYGAEHATLKTLAGSLEMGFTLALQIFAWWVGTEVKPVETDVNVELNKEYLNIKASPQEVQVALTALQAGEISFDTWYNFIMTGGWTREGIDAAEERKAIAEDKKLEPEPEEDEELSPPEPEEKKPPKIKTIRDSEGNVKYQIEESS